jgi:hypothetical protein
MEQARTADKKYGLPKTTAADLYKMAELTEQLDAIDAQLIH